MITTSPSEWRNGGNGDAFTLVELLVVIACIGILASLMFPALGRAKARAHATACQNHLRQMGLALRMYVDEHQSQYPLCSSPGDAGQTAKFGIRWFDQLSPYCALRWTNAADHCPGYKGQNDRDWGSYAYNAYGVVLTDSGAPERPAGLGLGPSWNPRYAKPKAVSEVQVAVPSEMFAIGESRFLSKQVNQGPGGPIFMVRGLLNNPQFMFDPARHGRNYNQLFCDGHVSAMNPRVLFNCANTSAMWNNDHRSHPEYWLAFP